MVVWSHLNNYFDFHVCLSIRSRSSSVPSVFPSRRKLTSVPSSVSQNVTNKSCLLCVKSENYASWVTLRTQWDCCRRGEAEVRILNFKTKWSEFQMPSQTAPAEAKPRCIYSILKPHGQSFKALSDRCHMRWSQATYIQSLKDQLPWVGPKQLCASAHLGCTCAVGTS